MYYTPNGDFTAIDASFYKNKVGQLHDTLQFQLIVYAIVKIIRRGTTVPLYELAAKQPMNINNTISQRGFQWKPLKPPQIRHWHP